MQLRESGTALIGPTEPSFAGTLRISPLPIYNLRTYVCGRLTRIDMHACIHLCVYVCMPKRAKRLVIRPALSETYESVRETVYVCVCDCLRRTEGRRKRWRFAGSECCGFNSRMHCHGDREGEEETCVVRWGTSLVGWFEGIAISAC